MKQLLFQSAFCLLMAAVAVPAATINCADQTNGPNGVGGNTLDKYVALGSGGCYLGNLLFSNFFYNQPALGTDAFYPGSGPKGTGTQQNANVVKVSVDPLNDLFEFGANWIVNHYQTASLQLSFIVTAPPTNPIDTIQSVFSASQGGTQNGGPTHTTTALCTGGTCGPTNFTNDVTAIRPTVGPLTITDTVTMNANGSSIASTNNYHLTIISDQFRQDAPPGVPEPATYAVTAAGLGLLTLARRRKRA